MTAADWPTVALVIANVALVVVTLAYVLITRRLAEETADMARSTRALAEGQVSAQVTLAFKAKTPANDEERRYLRGVPTSRGLRVVNHGPG